MKMRILFFLALAIMFGLTAQKAIADTITFSFSGVLNRVDAGISAAFAVGDTISASLTFDPAATSTGTPPNQGFYNTAIENIQVTTSQGYTASATAGQIRIYNDHSTWNDRILAVTFSDDYGYPVPPEDPFDLAGADVNGLPLIAFYVSLVDPTSTVFSGTGLPTSLDLSNFDLNDWRSRMQFTFGTAGERETYQRTAATIIPEPTSILLLGTGLGVLGIAAYRRRRK